MSSSPLRLFDEDDLPPHRARGETTSPTTKRRRIASPLPSLFEIVHDEKKEFIPTNRTNWDRNAIHQLAVQSEHLEIKFGEKLQQWFTLAEGFTVQHHADKFNRHDYIITHKDYPDRKVLLELECGKNQPQWINNINDNRQRWRYGLNVLSRKVCDGQNYDVFIKHNETGSSFFACTFDFVREHGKKTVLHRTSVGFITDTTVYAIPWIFVDEKDTQDCFCVDDPSRLRDMVMNVLRK